jgi:hypothetical protein
MAHKFDPQKFFGRSDNVALHVPASEVFGLLTRSVHLPAKWSALVTRKTGDHIVVAPGGVVEAGDVENVMFVRTSPIEVGSEEQGLITQDRFSFRADILLRVSVIPDRGELMSFSKTVVGSHRVVQAAGIARYLQPTVRTALARLAADRDAADLANACGAEDISTMLGEAVKGPCFAAGLRLEGPPTLKIESKTLRQVQIAEQETARRRAEHDAVQPLRQAIERAQAEHVDHLASLLTRLDDMAKASPNVELGALIRTFTDEQRGELYGALFAAERAGGQTQWIVVAAGDDLMFFDAQSLDTPSRQLKIAGSVGAVRSIQTSQDDKGQCALLLGASTGVYRLPIDRAEPDLTLFVEDAPEVRGGFNAAVVAGDRVFASHSEMGLCEWSIDEPNAVRYRFGSMTRDAKVVRDVQFFDGELYCSIDDRIICWPVDDLADRTNHVYTGSPATISSFRATSDGVFAGTSEGDVLHWPSRRDAEPERLHVGRQRAAESMWLLLSNGVRRLVFADTSLCVRAQVLGDAYACEYEAGGQTLRRVEVAPDIIVATNDQRDKLICWTPGGPDQPVATIPVSSLCGRSIQDVCLVARS